MGSATVLVVDDHLDILDVTRAMLARSSCDVLTADSGSAALDLLRVHPEVDLVLSEAMLPGMSGSELIDTVQRSYPTIAVMFMTAYTDEATDPAVPRIEKPFTVDRLRNRVQEVLAQSKQFRQELREAVSSTRNAIEGSRESRRQAAGVVAESSNLISRSRQLLSERQAQALPLETAVILLISPSEQDHTELQGILARPECGLDSGAKWELYPVPSLESAMSVLSQARFPIVITECDLIPGMWRDVLVETRRLRDPPLVIVTSLTADECLWAEALNLGAFDVLARPFDPGEVIRVLSFAWMHWKTVRKPRLANG